MRPDQTLVTLQREGTHVTARTSGPFIPEDAAGASEHAHQYNHLTAPLRQRGLACTIEYGLSDYIVHAELPDGSSWSSRHPRNLPPTTSRGIPRTGW